MKGNIQFLASEWAKFAPLCTQLFTHALYNNCFYLDFHFLLFPIQSFIGWVVFLCAKKYVQPGFLIFQLQ